MNTYIQRTLISLFFFICGIIFFAFQESWIIINIPQTTIFEKLQSSKTVILDAKLFAYKNNQWIQETKQIIKTDNLGQTIQNLLNSWFLFLQEEHIVTKSTTVESVVLSPTKKIAFISLDHTFFMPHATTYECLMFIEGIMKTMRENEINLQAAQFLIHHKPWNDHRLNMEIAWPLVGYTTH